MGIRTRGSGAGAMLCAIVLAGSPASAQDAAGKDLKIAAVLKTLANPYWQTTKDGIEAEAKAIGATVTVQAAADESAIDQQTDMLQTMVGQGYNCFIVAPITKSNLIQPLVAASKANAPIVAGDAFDEAALQAAGVKLATYVTVRHVDAGKAVAEVEALGRGGQSRVDRRVARPSRQRGTPRWLPQRRWET
jgi:ABC-type sugar transport system substrate-binding protein